MPPRRSTRASSTQPPTQEKPSSSKRKRGAPVEEEVIFDQENTKPVTRTRKSVTPSVPAATSRVSTRSRKSLEEVPESDDEEEPHPVKRSRPLIEPEEFEADEDVKPVRGRKGPARQTAPKAPVKKGRTSSRKVEEEAEEEQTEILSRGARSNASSSAKSSGRTVRTRQSKKVEESEHEEGSADRGAAGASEEEEFEEPKPASKRRSGIAKVADGTEEEDHEDSHSFRTTRRGSSSKLSVPTNKRSGKPGPRSRTAPGTKSRARTVVVESDAEDEDVKPDIHSEQSIGKTLLENTGVATSEDEEVHADNVAEIIGEVQEPGPTYEDHPPVEEDEEERSLLEAPASSPSQPQTQAAAQEPQGPKPRLVIHKMALVNFKSYAGRQEIGPFHKSFSAIVGPNGSGKSNTIDALLFVFGYRASKMRQGKLSELIHHSSRYPDLDECSVEVHFREIIDMPGPDAFELVPDSQLVVTRTAYKNNSSRYTINGRQSNYKEVQTLLKGRGIDLDHNRFLILQGEVESIAQMKPKAPSEHEDGLLEYLEDIIGTSKYKEPIEEALLEMDRLNEDRVEKLNRLKIVERERNALEEQKKEAEDYLRLQNEHVRALSRLWQWYLWRCFLNEEEFSKNIARIERELKEETDRNQDDITHLEMLEQHFKERGAAYEEVKAAAAEAVKDLTAHEKQQVSLEERKKHANSKAKKLKKSLQDDEHAKNEALRAINDNATKMEREKARVDELEASLSKEENVLEDIRDSLKDKTQVFHDQIEIKQKELQPWTSKINTKQAEIDVATSEKDTLAKKAAAIKEAFQEAQSNVHQLRADHDAKTAELEELKAERSTKEKEFKVNERRRHEMEARVQELRSKASSSRQKADEAKASQVASTSQNKVLESLTRLRSAGRISGFHGRLGSLGTIPDKYDVAVSTACGALNNLIVDTVEQGQACIEYLRKQNVGRASFIVLEKLSSKGLEKIPTPENVPRLFDLIKPKEPRFAPAFFKGVSNTLVVEDLDQANRIAFGSQRRWRVVTLAGQLIDSSGTMSGGGNHVVKGGMSSKLAAEAVSPEVLRNYEHDSEQAAKELEEVLQRLREMEAEIDSLAKSGPQLDVAIEKVNLDIENGAKRISEAEKRVRELKAQSKPDTDDIARIASLEDDIAASIEELEGLQDKTASIEQAIKDLEKKILDIGGAKLLSQKSKVDGIRLHINLANDEITKAEVAKAKAEKDSLKLEKALMSNKSGLEEVQAELQDLNEQLEECSQYVEDIRSKVEAAQTAAENSKDDLDNLKAELDAKTEEIQAFRQKEMELQQSLNDTKKEAAENGRALEHWQREHDKLKLEEIDEDEEEDGVPEPSKSNAEQVKPEPGDEHNLEKRGRSHAPSYELHIYSAEELATFKKRELIADAELLDEKLKNAKPNLAVLKDYRKREEEFLRRAQDLEQVTQLRDAQKQKYDGLTKQRLDEFMTGFNTISLKLKEMYQMITLGGNAELELVDSMDPFSEGIIFSVMPPKKSWRNISNLSGGEKTLSSLALVFALHVYKPTPLYFMDEIDAALDFRNVSIVANYIKDRTKNAQFIIISLRNDMFELSHRLIGIYKTANATQSISIDNHALHAIPLNAAH